MGQKISPNSFRLGIQSMHHSNWFIDPRNGNMKKIYPVLLLEDKFIRDYLTEKITFFILYPIESIQIRRTLNLYSINIRVGLLENFRLVIPRVFFNQLKVNLEREFYYYQQQLAFFFNVKKFPFFSHKKKKKIIREEQKEAYYKKNSKGFEKVQQFENYFLKKQQEKEKPLKIKQANYSNTAIRVVNRYLNSFSERIDPKQMTKYKNWFYRESQKYQLASDLLIPNLENINRNTNLYRSYTISGNKNF